MGIDKSLEQLKKYIEDVEYKGYDPYDTLNSIIPFHWLGKWGPILVIQFQKRNPVNIRKILGIKKDYNPKAMGLFLQTYSYEFQLNKKDDLKKKMDFFFNWLVDNRTKGYDEFCWGYNFGWASPVKYLEKYSPTVVVSGFIAKGIYEYYKATENPKALEVLESIGRFVKNQLTWTQNEKGLCVSYSTKKTDCCYNANMLGAELYARLFSITNNSDYKDLAIQMTNFTLAYQHKDGHWNYSIDNETGKERVQIDFHQGYILDAIYYVDKYCSLNNRYKDAIEKGLNYYYEKQFYRNGRSLFRVPKENPVEIHNQAQGILTFNRLSSFSNKYGNFSRTIAEWSIKNMQSKRGFFYYKKYPLYTIKTPFIRWSQAWMFLALTELKWSDHV